MSPSRRCTRSGAAAAAMLAVLVGGLILALGHPVSRAEARVTPRLGFRATVLGWTSWYGSYDLGPLGPAWCIDHGLTAPDPAFAYLPVSLPDVDGDTGAAISWAVSVHGQGNDPLEAAAVMMAIHDLRHAAYPYGPMNVDALTPQMVTGFGGQEGVLIGRARTIKAEAVAHEHLRAPFHLSATLDHPESGQGTLVARLVDAAGAPVAGAGLHLEATGAEIDQPDPPATAADGTARATVRLTSPPGPVAIVVRAVVPDPTPSAFAASTVRAQRVVRSSWLGVSTGVDWRPAPTTTTTTRPTTTTTGPTSITTTTTRPTTTTTRPTSITTTVAPPSTTPPRAPTTTVGSSATSTTTTPTPAMLPRTGTTSLGWAAIGISLIAGGGVLVGVTGPPRSDSRRRRQYR